LGTLAGTKVKSPTPAARRSIDVPRMPQKSRSAQSSGGIRTFADAQAMLDAGANRNGTSASASILAAIDPTDHGRASANPWARKSGPG
jgi:deoxyribose-phosphate aldolase